MTSGAQARATGVDLHHREAETARAIAEALRANAQRFQQRTVLCPRSGVLPLTLGGGLTLIAVLLHHQPQPVGAAAALLLMSAVTISFVLEAFGRENPLRWVLPDRETTLAQACWGYEASPKIVVAAAGQAPEPLLGSAVQWQRLLRLSLVAHLVLIALFAAGIVAPAATLRALSLAPAAVVLLVAALAAASASASRRAAKHRLLSAARVLEALATIAVAQPLQRHALCLIFFSSAPDCLFSPTLTTNDSIHARLVLLDSPALGSSVVQVAERACLLHLSGADLTLLTLARRLAETTPEADVRIGAVALFHALPQNTLVIQVGAGEDAVASATAFVQRLIQALDATSPSDEAR